MNNNNNTGVRACRLSSALPIREQFAKPQDASEFLKEVTYLLDGRCHE